MSATDYSTSPIYTSPFDVGINQKVLNQNAKVYDGSRMPAPPGSGSAGVDFNRLADTIAMAYVNTQTRTSRPAGSVGGPGAGQKPAISPQGAGTRGAVAGKTPQGGGTNSPLVAASNVAFWKTLAFPLVAAVIVFLVWHSWLWTLVAAVAAFIVAKLLGWGG